MRIALDTGVVLSALLWSGPTYRLLQMAIDDDGIDLISSPILLDELRDVLTRGAVATRVQSSLLEQALVRYASATIQIAPTASHGGAEDGHVASAAIAAQADLIVSSDDDLLGHGAIQGIPVVPVAEAVRYFVPVGDPLL